MLRVVQSTSAGQARHYYTEGLEHGDYYTGETELAGRWGGRGAQLLGLRGDVDRASFHRLCENEKPDGSGKLTARTKANRRVGYDMNFHAPKGVSVAHALTGDRRLLDAVVDAATAAMERMEVEAKARVRVENANSDRVTGNLLWAAFPHLTTRPIDGVPDPHLHVHCYVFNATYDATEGKWKAGEFGDLKRNAPFFEAHFHAALMKRVGELGYAVREDGRHWDIAGMPAGLLEKYSRRTAEIEAVAAAKGIKDVSAKAALGAKTRRSKGSSLPFDAVRTSWRERLSGSEKVALEALKPNETALSSQPITSAQERTVGPLERYSAKRAIDRALEHCFERLSVATERQVLGAALRFGSGRVQEDALQAELAARDVLRKETKRGDILMSLPAVLAEEKRLLEFARAGRSACGAFAHGAKSKLAQELDRRLVEHVLESRDRVTLLRMPAAVERESVMRETIEQLHVGGQRVTVVSAAASTRAGLLGEGVESLPLQKLLSDDEAQKRARGNVLWVEGGNLLGAQAAARLFDFAQKHGGRIVLSGDTRRPPAAGRGDVMRLLERLAGLESPRAAATSSTRDGMHTQQDVRELVSAGDLPGALQALERGGGVARLDAAGGFPAVTSAYVQAAKAKERCVVVASDKTQALAVTERIRDALRREKLLQKASITFRSLEPVHGTMTERRLASFYKAGQVVQFSQHVKGFKAGERYTVVGHDPFGHVLARQGGFVEALPLSRPEHFDTFAPRDIELSPGDVVRVTRTGAAKSSPLFPGILARPWRHRLQKGSLQRVKSLSEGDITLANGIIVSEDFGHLAHGYCLTAREAEGMRFDRALLLPGRQLQEAMHVVAAAARKALHVFTDDFRALLAGIPPAKERLSATELGQRPQAQPHSHRPPTRDMDRDR